MPPALIPVNTILLAPFKLYFDWIQAMWDLVIKDPLKYKDASLYLIGSFVYPWCKEPSQYGRNILVQFANGLIFGSVDKYPYASSLGSIAGHGLELPKKSFER